jgi:deoxyribonuclease IV
MKKTSTTPKKDFTSTKPKAAKPVAAKAKTPKAASKKSPASAIEPLHFPPGVLMGAHTSTSGGVSQSIARAQACGFTAAQIFVKNNKQWFAPPLSDAEASEFRALQKASGIYFFAHNSYLVNLASQDATMFATSVKAMIQEVERAEVLGLPFIVMHPGSHGGAGEEAGLARIVQGLDEIVKGTEGFRCRMALEITAGQGNALGYRLEHLAFLRDHVTNEKRFGFCLDTAHLYAAGYNIRTPDGYEATMSEIKNTIGTKNVLGLHLNDSKVPLGKRVDRHEHLGEGEIGLECFQRIVQDTNWASTPKVLETPKSEDMHEDIENLRKLAPYLQ